MPAYTYTVDKNLSTERKEACEALASYFYHCDALDINVSSITITVGTVTITGDRSISSDEKAHLGVS